MNKSRVLGLASVFTVTVGLLVAAPLSAQAASCYGDYCSGQDPQSTGCSDANTYTATSYNTSLFSLQVRYSPTCQTNWTRLVMYSPGWQCSLSGYVRAIQDTGYTQTKYYPGFCNNSNSDTTWSPMIYSPVHQVKGTFTDQNGTVYTTPWA